MVSPEEGLTELHVSSFSDHSTDTNIVHSPSDGHVIVCEQCGIEYFIFCIRCFTAIKWLPKKTHNVLLKIETILSVIYTYRQACCHVIFIQTGSVAVSIHALV